MEGGENLTDGRIYETLGQGTIIQNNLAYELQQVCTNNEDRIMKQWSQDEVHQSSNKKQSSSWSPPFIVLTVLLCLILILLVAILCLMVAQMSANDGNTATSTGSASSTLPSNTNNHNFTLLADGIFQILKSLPDFNEWASDVVNKVNTNVTQSLPNFNEWANDVINKVNTNVTQSLPNFNEWANDVINKVNTNVTQSLTKWAEIIVQNVYQRITNNGQNFTELTDVLINNINTAVNESLPNFNEWANGVVNKVNTNVTQSLPNFNEWANDLVSRISADCNVCGSSEWTRLAYLDMSDSTQNCPSGFKLYNVTGVRACGRPGSSASCVSVQFPSNGISYSQICGRVTGYQYDSTNAFDTTLDENRKNLSTYYVDGVSITRGSPRQHVWTFAAGITESSLDNPSYICPCINGSTESVPSFVGSHYYCESGNNNTSWSNILYTSDPLWDGQGCGPLEAPCCTAPGLPWFHRDYGTNTTTDYIELRVCGDQDPLNEDNPVGFYEIYVK